MDPKLANLGRHHCHWASWTFGLVPMGGHFSVACPTQLSVPSGPRWHTLAPHTACAARPVAQVWSRMKTAPLLAQTSTI